MHCLREISARMGSDPLLTQAATGNTSLKIDDVLWVKASGKWLAHARTEDIFIPLSLKETRARIGRNIDPSVQSATLEGKTPGTSVETSTHAILPHRVVFHVHSVNTIALAVRQDGQAVLSERLAGMNWRWVPYVSSGLPLAHAIEAAVAAAPETNVFVLANHGLIVCADNCDIAGKLLFEVESRLATKPRPAFEPDWAVLERLAARSGWFVPRPAPLHTLALDPIAQKIACGGVLYPCQAMFLATQLRVFQAAELPRAEETRQPFVLVDRIGVLARSKPNAVELATLVGFAQVVQRIPESACVRYLTGVQVEELLSANVHRYKQIVKESADLLRPEQIAKYETPDWGTVSSLS